MSFKIYSFGLGEDVTETSKEILGGKGAGLVWMSQNDYPVPPGFIIPTTYWTAYDMNPSGVMETIAQDIAPYLTKLKEHFGYVPLLSVRSGARVSMPGMMDTILNVGLDSTNSAFWTDKLGPAAYADTLSRLAAMYTKTVGVGVVPTTGEKQLLGAIEAVFKSWNSDRAKTFRKLHGYDDSWGTAVVIQAMVFGNLNADSATGVLFTRDTNTGAKTMTGEFIIRAQGEDIVAGTHTPRPIHPDFVKWSAHASGYLIGLASRMEAERREVQDIEFTVQDGKLYLLQCRTARRTARANLQFALDFIHEGRITEAEAVRRISARDLDLLDSIQIDPGFAKKPDYTGIAASQGIVTGKPVFTSEDAVASTEPCILITQETTPEDIAGMNAAVGIITLKGGLTAHAAVVARGMNKPCIVGLGGTVTKFKKAAHVSMDGATGRIWRSKVPVVSYQSPETVAAIQRLVFRASGALPIITKVPETLIPEALLALEVRDLLNPASLRAKIYDYSEKVEVLYLDMEIAASQFLAYFNIFTTLEQRKDLLVKHYNNLFHSAFPHTVVPIVSYRPAANLHHEVKYWVPVTPTIEELITSPELIYGSYTHLPLEAATKVLGWRKDLKLISVGKAAGGKSFLSFEQALQSLQP